MIPFSWRIRSAWRSLVRRFVIKKVLDPLYERAEQRGDVVELAVDDVLTGSWKTTYSWAELCRVGERCYEMGYLNALVDAEEALLHGPEGLP